MADKKQLVYPGRSVRAYYKPDRRSIARCAVGPELHHAVHDVVENVAKPFAIGISPRDTGAYAKSFEISTTYVAYGFPDLMTRVAARLYNTDEAAAAIEYGRKTSKGQKGAHVLLKTLEMLTFTQP